MSSEIRHRCLGIDLNGDRQDWNEVPSAELVTASALQQFV